MSSERMANEAKNDGVVRWEKFLPKMVMRVLLVESDDCTRQIITALLRKCNYKVAAVADGLKAWEILKGRPQSIDLILTEVELPSVSGFALLTLVAEHDVCKNIPVIMMSAQDSVNTVYKCMLRGAADFLVKPLRKNELKNLWQHVWRRQASASETPQATSDAQHKVEATAENNAPSNHSSGYEACIKRDRECIEKGSDAQSSCAKPDLQAEEANLGYKQDLTQQNQHNFLLSGIKRQKYDQCVKESAQIGMPDGEASGSLAVPLTSSKDNVAADGQWDRANVSSEAFDKNNVPCNPSREAIDLIGAFENYPKLSYRSLGATCGTNKVDSSSLLDLTLRSSHPSGSVNQVLDDGHRLKQSDASAFSRYVSRPIQPLHTASASISNQRKGYETSCDKQKSNQALDHTSDTLAPAVGSDINILSRTSGQVRQAEIQFPCPQHKVIQVPARGANHESLSNAQRYPFDPQTRSSPQLCNVIDENLHKASSDQMEHKQGHKPDHSEDQGHFSSATDQSGSSSFCNSTLKRFNSINSGNIGNANSVPNMNFGPESGNEATLTQEGSVRYESRKKLAEQRPRVKGQFVRQLQTGIKQ
ncbi:hypothetical protein DCAR_0416353 [Daucus carota subsp. sativus]|uniref:Response regulatory domain-containing protein n=1 Tax=Daucus carota subsp. sativus TaxID=79200 RepID=A0AAF0WWS2_DAUCS|nr:hypothetical protein DCAR_0416353 [Daucus carota subsp. sativus]